VTEVETAGRAHAQRILTRDPAARHDLTSGAALSPPELLDRLLQAPFETFELVAHARIGEHHLFKTKLVGPTIIVLQARWARDPDGVWRVREAEVARTEMRRPPAPSSAVSPGSG